MSAEEKQLNAWNRKKRSKESFEVLLVDSMYYRWLPEFLSELAVQGLEDIVDKSPIKDPNRITNPFLIELYVQQSKYLWTVLLRVFKNPLGKSCISDNRKTSNARGAFLSHSDHQESSPAQLFSTTQQLTLITTLTLSTHTGTRVEFISNWFENVCLLNDNADTDDQLGFILTRSLILSAVANSYWNHLFMLDFVSIHIDYSMIRSVMIT